MSANTSGVDKSAGWVISMLICGWWWALSANAAPLLVERVGLERGLSQLSITASLQDSRGFWWFGTQAGLNRYNGYAFRVFRRDFSEETRSIPDDYITALMEADDGRIYIGTGSRGMAIFDPLTEQFAHIHSGSDTTSQLSNGQVLDLAQGPAGFIWIATDGGGLNRLDPATGIVTRIRHDATDPTSILSDQVTEVFFDDQKRLWVGSKLGLQVLENGEFRPVPLASSGPVYVTALIPGPAESLWVGTTTGLFAVNPQGNIRFFKHDATSTQSLAHNHVETLHTDRNGFLWIGTRNGLSRLIDPQAGRFETHRTDAFNIKSLSGSRVSSILEDRHGLLWFGTWVGGLSVYNPNAVGFQVYRYNGEEPSIPDNRVRSFAQTSDGSVWIATLGGLVRFDPGNSHFSDVYQHEPGRANSLSSSEIHAVVVDEQDHIWVGTRNAGLNRIDPATGEVDAYRYRDDDSSSIGSDQILTLKIASDGRIWIGFEDRGISIFDPITQSFVHHRRESGLQSNTVGAFFEDSQGRMWIGSRGDGLALYQPEQTPPFEVFAPGLRNTEGLLHGNITSFAEDADGSIWLTTQGAGFARSLGIAADGVHRFKSFTTNDGLPGNALGIMLFDNQQKAWMSTLHGVSQYDPAQNVFRNFYPHDGVQAEGYYVDSGMKDQSGRLYFGGIDGFTLINPQLETEEPEAPRVTLTNLIVAGVPVQPAASRQESPIAYAVDYLDSVTLDHTQNDIGFEFTSLVFEVKAAVQFSYRLLGQNDRWTELPVNRQFAGFTNLGAGVYQLEVRARRQSGGYGPIRSMTIERQQAPWLSPWAWTLYTAVVLAVVGMFWRSRYVRLRGERNAARKVQDSERMLKLALTGSGADVWVMDFPTGELRRTFSSDEGYSLPSEVRSMAALQERIHPEDREPTQRLFQAHIKGERPGFDAVYRILNDQNEYRWAYSQGRVTKFDSNGKALELAGSTRDITPLKTAEEQLRKLNEKLESRVAERTADLTRTNEHLTETLDQLQHAQSQLVESEKMAALGSLVAGVAHEINTPLGVAVTAASLIESQCKQLIAHIETTYGQSDVVEGYTSTLTESIRFILQNLSRAAELVRSFKQVAVDQSADDIREFALDEYLDEILKSWQPRLKRVPHQVSIDCPADIQLRSFPGALYQVISNLLMNSLLHAFTEGQKGRITIHAVEEQDHALITYRDDGKGFGADVREHIFEPFFTTKRGSGGSGLGMHIVYNLVTGALRGQISCTSEQGKGMEVRIRIPKVVQVNRVTD